MLDVRRADGGDLDAVVELTRRRRAQLAGWGPDWWRPAAEADAMHRTWLGYLLGDERSIGRVVLDGNRVVGCAFAVGLPGGWFVDDLAVDDGRRWPDVAAALRSAVGERPALSCVPTGNDVALAALEAAGLRRVASYWIVPARPAPAPADWEPGDADAAPPHTFGALFADGRAMRLAVAGGSATASASVPAPPIFDPGGTVRIVERVDGDREGVVAAVVATAGNAGDVLVCFVAGNDDHELQAALAAAGAVRTVEVLAWP